jgi:hypothetical protein
MSDIDADLAFGAVEAMQATIDKQAAEIERLRAALRDIQKFSLELYATGVARAALEERT